MERIDGAGLTIAFERTGQGAPFVLLRGGPSDSRKWQRQIDALCESHELQPAADAHARRRARPRTVLPRQADRRGSPR